jgi:hypothetical protein
MAEDLGRCPACNGIVSSHGRLSGPWVWDHDAEILYSCSGCRAIVSRRWYGPGPHPVSLRLAGTEVTRVRETLTRAEENGRLADGFRDVAGDPVRSLALRTRDLFPLARRAFQGHALTIGGFIQLELQRDVERGRFTYWWEPRERTLDLLPADLEARKPYLEYPRHAREPDVHQMPASEFLGSGSYGLLAPGTLLQILGEETSTRRDQMFTLRVVPVRSAWVEEGKLTYLRVTLDLIRPFDGT